MPDLHPLPQPPTSEERPRPGPSALDWAVAAVIVLFLAAAVAMELLKHWGLAAQSQEDAVFMLLLAGTGLAAGFVASLRRKLGELRPAVTGYRVAVWCWFLALVMSWQWQVDRKAEESRKQFEEQWRKVEQLPRVEEKGR